jgi:hypothetical protein
MPNEKSKPSHRNALVRAMDRSDTIFWAITALVTGAASFAAPLLTKWITKNETEKKELHESARQNSELLIKVIGMAKNGTEAEVAVALGVIKHVSSPKSGLKNVDPCKDSTAPPTAKDQSAGIELFDYARQQICDTQRPRDGSKLTDQERKTESTIAKVIDKDALEDSGKAVDAVPDNPPALPRATENREKSSIAPRVYIHIANESQREAATALSDKLVRVGVIAPSVELVSKGVPRATNLRHCKTDDETYKRINDVLTASRTDAKRYPLGGDLCKRTRDHHYELWYSAPTR